MAPPAEENILNIKNNQWLEVIVHFLSGFRNDTADFSRPHVRASLASLYPLLVLLYALLVVLGLLVNNALLGAVVYGRHHFRDMRPSGGLLANLAAANIAQCACVLPMSLSVLLVQNWVFGRFLCYVIPMVQDIPVHVSTLTYLLISLDRYRYLKDPEKPRLPTCACALGTWLMAVCIVLPYPIYVTYLDLESVINSQFQGVGICLLNLAEDMQQYVRALFIAMYVLPMVLIVYFNVKISKELKSQEGRAMIVYAPRSRTASGSQDIRFVDVTNPVPSDRMAPDPEIDVQRERRTQRYFTSMLAIYAICFCPLMVLRLVKMALTETYENSGHFDVIFALFVWLAFVPTCTTPCLLFFWFLSSVTKDRLKCCFRPSDRKFRGVPLHNVGAPSAPVSTGVADLPPAPNAMAPMGVAFTRQSAYPTVPHSNAFDITK